MMVIMIYRKIGKTELQNIEDYIQFVWYWQLGLRIDSEETLIQVL